MSLAFHAGEHPLVRELATALLAQPLADRSREEVVCALALSQVDLGRAEKALQLADLHLARSGLRPSDYHVVRAQAFLATGRARAALLEQEPFLAAEPVQSMATAMAPVFAWAAYFAGLPPPSPVAELLDWGMLAGVAPELAGIDQLRAGRPEEAAARFQQAADLYAGYSTRASLRCRWAHADALIQTSRRTQGKAALAEVETTAQSLGLAPVLRLVARSRGTDVSSRRLLRIHRRGTPRARSGRVSGSATPISPLAWACRVVRCRARLPRHNASSARPTDTTLPDSSQTTKPDDRPPSRCRRPGGPGRGSRRSGSAGLASQRRLARRPAVAGSVCSVR